MIKNALRIGRLLAFSLLLSAALGGQVAIQEAGSSVLSRATEAASAQWCASTNDNAIAEAPGGDAKAADGATRVQDSPAVANA